MQFVEVLKKCEAANGAGTKKVIQAALAELDDDGRELMRYMMDPYKTFGVKKYDNPKDHTAIDGHLGTFFELLDKLAARELTGNAARAAVQDQLGYFTAETASYLARVLDKEPRAGFSPETFNKVWPDEKVPTWEQQLADKCEDAEDFDDRCTFPAQADVKYDGTRQFAFYKDGVISWHARGGRPSTHLDGVFDAELHLIREQFGHDFVLDGEVMAASFLETQNTKKGGSDRTGLVFRTFFIMPVEDWVAQKTTITNRTSRDLLRNILSAIEPKSPSKMIRLTEGKIVNNYHEMVEYCDQVIDDASKTKAEREGLIVKQLDATYQWERTFDWIKVKRFYDVDARFVKFYEARPKTRLSKLGLIGGAECYAFLESGERVEFRVGSGFSFEQRRDMRDNPQHWLNSTHVIKYQEVSKGKAKKFSSLRFCTYESTRDDKIVEG